MFLGGGCFVGGADILLRRTPAIGSYMLEQGKVHPQFEGLTKLVRRCFMPWKHEPAWCV